MDSPNIEPIKMETGEVDSKSKKFQVCKFGSNCKKVSCKFNHPNLTTECKNRAGTLKSDVVFNRQHQKPLCRYSSDCQRKSCVFRHVLTKFQEKERDIITSHKNLITELVNQFELVKSSCEPENMELVGPTLVALQSKLDQLQAQLSSYEYVKKQIQQRHNVKNEWKDEQLERELYRLQIKLPALAKRQELDSFINEGPEQRFLIIQGQTGSGKSTQIPQYAADHPRFFGKRIICTQPRKIAAISLAKHVATEYAAGAKIEPGAQVGYRVPGDKRCFRGCRVEYVTEGIMLNWILKGSTCGKKDPFRDIGCIIIDEAHERSVTCDLLLGSFKKDDPRWHHVLFIVSSATIDLEMFTKFFLGAPSLEIEGRTFPVQISYCPLQMGAEMADILSSSVKQALHIHQAGQSSPGDILCFLPSQDAVLTAVDRFEKEVKTIESQMRNNNLQLLTLKVMALFGRQEPEAQAEVFKQVDKKVRKVIFSTDLAETSITIDGVVYVIDSGLKKDIIYDSKRKLSSLKLQKICRSSAIQRAGRSGRTQPGHCYRLYSEDDFETMEINSLPEILRKPLALAILTLRDMKIDPHQFDWISQPSMEALQAAEDELVLLGAVTKETNCITDLGKLISSVQQEPCLVRMIQFACQRGFGEAALKIAGILSVSNIFFWKGSDDASKAQAKEKRNRFLLEEGDVVSMYRAFEEWLDVSKGKNNQSTEAKSNPRKSAADWCRANYVNNKALGIALSTISELKSYFKKTKAWTEQSQNQLPTSQDIQRIIFSGQFLNTSCLLRSRTRQPQYYSLQTDVIGNQSFGSAIMVACGNVQNQKPEWIVYDKLLRLQQTLLITTTKVEKAWLEEENIEFAEFCHKKSETLPISFTKYYSPEILRGLFGKYFCKLDSLEQELQCSLEGHIDSGSMTIYCDRQRREEIDKKIHAKVELLKTEFKNAVSEEEYLGGVRVVIGEGYQVKEVLFPMEFSRIYIRNLPPSVTEGRLHGIIQEPFDRANNQDSVIKAMELVKFQQGQMCSVRFINKQHAKVALEKLTGRIIDNSKLSLNPGGIVRRGITPQVSGRLKLSWATRRSKQTAKLWFDSAKSANNFIQNSYVFLHGASVQSVHGHLEESLRKGRQYQGRLPKKPEPPLMRLPIPRKTPNNMRGQYFRFDEDAIELMPESMSCNFDFSLTVADLPIEMDEYDIRANLKHLNLKGVKVDRHQIVPKEAWSDNNVDLELKAMCEERLNQVRPLTKYITNDTQTVEFVEKAAIRRGYSIYFNQVGTLRQAYLDILGSPEWKTLPTPCGQSQRLEIEYTFTASIHVELHKFIKLELERLEEFAKSKGAIVSKTEPKNETAKFHIIRFRHESTGLFQELQQKLDEIAGFTKINGDDVRLLFTWTGREQVKKLGNRAFLHMNYKSAEVLIYGRPHIQKQYEKNLKEIIEKLKSLKFLDHPINLNKKKVDVVRRQKDFDKINELCLKTKISFHHFSGNRLFVSGTDEAVGDLQKTLESSNLSFTRPPIKYNIQEDCGLCFSSPEDGNFIITTACQHVFCIECLQGLFDQHQNPICCPAAHEEPTPLFLNDICKAAPLSSLPSMLEIAVRKYQEQNASDVKICPKPGCNQFLCAQSVTTGPFGGEFVFCDVCVSSYCLSCTEKLNKPIPMHEDESCNEIQTGSSGRAQVFIRTVQETVLNLSCPRCKTVFLEFDGCAAVTCSSCNCAFCGICLTDCGTDAHSHVRGCSLNPNRSYFISRVDLNKAQSKMRTEKLRAYLDSNVTEPEIRKIVIRGLCKDLIDLNMDPNDF